MQPKFNSEKLYKKLNKGLILIKQIDEMQPKFNSEKLYKKLNKGLNLIKQIDEMYKKQSREKIKQEKERIERELKQIEAEFTIKQANDLMDKYHNDSYGCGHTYLFVEPVRRLVADYEYWVGHNDVKRANEKIEDLQFAITVMKVAMERAQKKKNKNSKRNKFYYI